MNFHLGTRFSLPLWRKLDRTVVCARVRHDTRSLLWTLTHLCSHIQTLQGSCFKTRLIIPHCSTRFEHVFVNACGAFVLTCDDSWVLSHKTVRLEKLVLQELWKVDMTTSDKVQQLREWITLQASQLEAVVKELTSQVSAATQAETRSSLSFVDTNLLTKTNVIYVIVQNERTT